MRALDNLWNVSLFIRSYRLMGTNRFYVIGIVADNMKMTTLGLYKVHGSKTLQQHYAWVRKVDCRNSKARCNFTFKAQS